MTSNHPYPIRQTWAKGCIFFCIALNNMLTLLLMLRNP